MAEYRQIIFQNNTKHGKDDRLLMMRLGSMYYQKTRNINGDIFDEN